MKQRPSVTMDTSSSDTINTTTTRKESILKSGRNKLSDNSDEVFGSHSENSTSPRAPPPPSQTAGQLPAQYDRVRAARKHAFRATVLGGIGAFPRQHAVAYPDNVGHIDVAGDARHLACQNVHSLRDKKNFSLSFNPAALECLGCAEKHKLIRGDIPVVVVASDHNFSPVLPAALGKECVSIIRVEDGKLSEILELFRDIFREHIRPVGQLPPGSVVLLGSLSHLSMYGLQHYTDELVRTMTILGSEIGVGTTIIPYVPIPLAGVGADDVIRELLDFDCWLGGSGLGDVVCLPETRDLFWELAGTNSVTLLDAGSRTYFMPTSVRNPRKQRFVSGPICPPATMAPLSKEDESAIVCCLLSELSNLLSLKLDTSPNFARGGAAPRVELAERRVAILGASHAKRLSALAGESGIVLLPRWAPDTDTVREIVAEIAELKLTSNDILVVDIFSNMIYMGTDEDGLAVRAFKGLDGHFHIPGILEVATKVLIKRTLVAATPAVSAAGAAKIVFVLPIPRYATRPCCTDAAHMQNRKEADFLDILSSAGPAVRAIVEGEVERLRWHATVFDPMTSFDQEETLADTLSSAGISIWTAVDGVHLTNTAYRDILDNLRQTETESTATAVTGRDRLPSIIPVSTTVQRDNIPVPAWFSGGEDRGGFGGRGRWLYRGRRGGRRGRGGRWAPY